MSKKTIAFTMPARGRGPRERTPVVLDGLTGESIPFAAAEASLRDTGSGSKTDDEWVRDLPSRDRAGAPLPEPTAPRAFAVGVTINLAAERNLMEAMTLSFMVPVALGWFWFAHAMMRRPRLWG